MKRLILSATALLLLVAACGPPRIRPFREKLRKYKAETYDAPAPANAPGSLWRDDTGSLYTFSRSARVGDLLTVMIKETANASRDASTGSNRTSSIALGVTAFAGLMKKLKAADSDFNPAKILGASTKNDFTGKGQTKRSGTLTATITARIKRVLPNGDRYIEGSKVVMVNEEESHLYFSGVVRPTDIQADNSVSSHLIADMQIEYTGRGPVSDPQHKGWLARFVDWINPF